MNFTLQNLSQKAHLQPLPKQGVEFVTSANISEFATFCGRLIRDREATDPTFESRRATIYQTWLANAPHGLVSVRHPSGQLLAATILLPLTQDAYRSFCEGRLDSIDMNSAHFTEPSPAAPNHILIDAIAADIPFINSLPEAERTALRGLAFRAMFHHLEHLVGTSPHLHLAASSTEPRAVSRFTQLGFQPLPPDIYHLSLTP